MNKWFFVIVLLSTNILVQGQVSEKNQANKQTNPKSTGQVSALPVQANGAAISDSAIKEGLVEIVMKNPAIKISDANIAIAKANLRKAKSSFLNSVQLSGNINEFVVNGSDAANFYPKYNVGVFLPMDVFSRVKAEKNVAAQNLNISNELKETKIREVKAAVLILYENYKEQKELVRLQRISMEPDLQSYLSAQKNYSEGVIQIDELNLAYQAYLNQQSKLVSKERDLNVAIYELEQLLGISLNQALAQITAPVTK
jgi:outer membrane protein TolC